MIAQGKATRVGFGLFEADLQTGELWKAGRKVKLQGQPFRLLTVLVEHPGEVVTREELQTRLWGKEAVGGFDQSLGTAINKIREALGDTADNPRFVETLARRGYRWIAPVSVLARQHAEGDPHALDDSPPPPSEFPPLPAAVVPAAAIHVDAPATGARVAAAPAPRPSSALWQALLAALVGASLALAAVLGWLWSRPETPRLRRVEQLTHSGRIAPGMLATEGRVVPGMLAMENLPAGVTDGARLYISVLDGGRSVMNEVNVRTGTLQPMSIPSEIASPTLGDLSPDGSTLLLRSHLSPESEQAFWTVSTSGGSALRLPNVVGHDATWMPDGRGILVASGNRLMVKSVGDGPATLLATLPERAFWLRWSPDGSLLRFTLLDPIAHTMRLAELHRDGSGLRMLLEHWSDPASECCGVWSGSGDSFVFQSDHGHSGGSIDLWRLPGKSVGEPVRVTNGPMSYVAPIASRLGETVYFLGLETRSALQQFDRTRREYRPEQRFLADAARIEYSRDGRWVTWTDLHGRQWRAHSDGSETIRLTPDAMQVFLGRWSPDGQTIALMARDPGRAWRIYLVAAEGGAPEPLLEENRNEADPSWSPDGKRIVFGRVSDVMGKEEGPRQLEMVDVATRKVTPVAGSDNVFSPRWSPDGRSIAALSLDQRKLLLWNTASATWQTLAETTAADPVWSADGRFIFFHAALADGQPIYRLAVAGGVPERVASLASFPGGTTADYFFCGLTPDDAPIVRIRTATGNLYSVDLGER